MKTPESNDSLLKRILVELPHYSYNSAASSEATGRGFVGRKGVLRCFKELIRDGGDKVGVYLVTGNRGVGKTKLIDAVEKETSLDVGFKERVKHLLVLFCAVAGTQFCLSKEVLRPVVLIVGNFFGSAGLLTTEETVVEAAMVTWIRYVVCALCPISFFALCYLSEFRRRNCGLLSLLFAAFKELFFFGWKIGSYRNTRYLLRVAFIVGFTQIVYLFSNKKVTATVTFLVCLGVVLAVFLLWKGIDDFCRFSKGMEGNYGVPDRGFRRWCRERVFGRFGDLIEGYNRVYLRINFGHALKDEKDILGLIARTLLSEYRKYHRSFWRLPVWRVISVVFLFIFAGALEGVVRDSAVWKSAKKWVLEGREDAALPSESDYAAYIKNINAKTGDNVDGDVKSADAGDKKIYIVKGFFGAAWAKKIVFGANTGVTTLTRKVEKLPRFLWNGEAKDREGGADYPFWIAFVGLYGCFVSLFRTRWLSRYFVTHRMILGRLRDLNGDITHATELERSLAVPTGAEAGAKVGGKVKRTRGLADAREIERVLQDIFQDIRRMPAIMGRPKFVVVFDELDKVEPGEAESAGVGPVSKAALFSIDAARKRQTEILKIMSNMKYFLSTSEAKFVFIAGREMYDIYLADVSDRNNYIGSIFSAVIEVPSFLTDHAAGVAKSNMTTLTEEFVCRRLLPYDYPVKDGLYSLENYRTYLEDTIFKKKTNGANNDEIDLAVRKTIAVLEHFIVYLAHVSKGAPKKMVQLFEAFIDVRDVDENKNEKEYRADKYINVKRYNRSKFFLRFSYYRQYTIGLIAYLVTPIFYRLADRNISRHNDKLLVSSLRFVDFVFKFHKHSFMWKHLDISPEMLEVNRAPELRPIIVDLLNYMTQMHITKSNFSLFDYRFDSRIANEIFAAARTDELLSAMFSFSLDETLPLKKHYQDLLAGTRKEYQNEARFSPGEFIDTVSSLQIVLGDLHYFDDELEEAGMYYRDAIEALRKFGSKDDAGENGKAADSDDGKRARRESPATMGPEYLFLFIRNMLKLGMIYETRKQNEQAYMIYGEVCMRVIRERNIAIRELGAGIVVRKVVRKGEEPEKIGFIKDAAAVNKLTKNDELYNDNIDYQETEEDKLIGSDIAQLSPLYFKRLSPNTNDMLFRKMSYEGLKLLYLPFLVKLQILEKSHMGGIARTHLEQFDKEFELLTFIVDHEEAKILEADFCSRAADVLYYKNSDLKNMKERDRIEDDYTDKYAEAAKQENNNKTCEPENCSCTACHYYHKAISKLLNMDKRNQDAVGRKGTAVMKLLTECVERLSDVSSYRANMKFCIVLGRVLSDWGNVFLSCDIVKKDGNTDENRCYIGDGNIHNEVFQKTEPRFRKACFEYAISDLAEAERKRLVEILQEYEYKSSKQGIAYAMYTISFQAFRRAGRLKSAVFQVYKMLRLFKRYEIDDCDEDITRLSKKAISLHWLAADELNALEMNNRKKDFGLNVEDDKTSLKYLLVDSEIAVIAVLVNEIKLKLEVEKRGDDTAESEETTEKRFKALNDLHKLEVASPYGIMYSMTARIFQLRLKADINYETYKMLIPTDLFDVEKKLDDEVAFITSKKGVETVKEKFGKVPCGKNEKSFFARVVSESIFCLREMIRLSKTLGEAYLFNHYFMGETHSRLSFWVKRYEAYIKRDEKSDDGVKLMKEKIEHFLEEGWKEKLTAQYEIKQALRHYYKSLEMHVEGKAYHIMVDSMYFVRDDYNDRSDHFSIAIERHRIKNGEIRDKIRKLEKKSVESEWYNVKNYI